MECAHEGSNYNTVDQWAELFCARQVGRVCDQLIQRLNVACGELREPGRRKDPFNILHECSYQADSLKKVIDCAGFGVEIAEQCVSRLSTLTEQLDLLQKEQVGSKRAEATTGATGEKGAASTADACLAIFGLIRMLRQLEASASELARQLESQLGARKRSRRHRRSPERLEPCVFWILVLSDLHLGADDLRPEWAQILQQFRRDLQVIEKEVLKQTPWDLTALAGDLIGKGNTAQFNELSNVIDNLWGYWEEKGWRPCLVAVPGNHDLVRPDPDEPHVKLLMDFHRHPELADALFGEGGQQKLYRLVIDDSFGAFSTWLSGQQHRRPGAGLRLGSFALGSLPGDFCACVEKDDGTKLGVVGLNSAFLHLADTKKRSSHLQVRTEQFNAVGGPTWCERQHVRLLLTHHPPDWLHRTSGEHFWQSIDSPGRFALHICGHQHKSYAATGSTMGRLPTRLLVNSSLCGRDHFGHQRNRRHGYTVVMIARGQDDRWCYRYWPRLAKPELGWEFQPDGSYRLEHDNGTREEYFQ